jgi:sporulation protein YlmC with PRC-barrel domain
MAGVVNAQQSGFGAQTREHFVKLRDEPTAEVIPLREWNYKQLRDGWSAKAILGAPVREPSGDEIGEVENLFIDGQGKIVALVVQFGSFWKLGETHVAIPWQNAEHNDHGILIPITEEAVRGYGRFEQDFFSRLDIGNIEGVTKDVRTEPRLWKATDLVDGYVVVEPNEQHGDVEDLIFNDLGNLHAVLVKAADSNLANLEGDSPEVADRYGAAYRPEEIAGLTVVDYRESGR